MTTTSQIPITVDGVRLDTLAWNIETLNGRLAIPSVRGSDPIVPGDDGSVFIPNKNYDTGKLTLSMWVRGSDIDGLIPGGSSKMAEFRKNLDSITKLFTVRHRLLDIQQTWPGPQTIQYKAQVVQPWDFSANAVDPRAKFAVELNIPGVFGQDVNTTDFSSATGLTTGTTVTINTHAGHTAPINDAILVVRGPATNPRLTNPDTGEWVQYNGTIATGSDWRIDCGLWETRTGVGIGLSSGAGTNVVANTQYAGGGARFIRLTPRSSGGPQVVLTGTGFSTGTQVLARARRKFIV
jgi:hypothetical protein